MKLTQAYLYSIGLEVSYDGKAIKIARPATSNTEAIEQINAISEFYSKKVSVEYGALKKQDTHENCKIELEAIKQIYQGIAAACKKTGVHCEFDGNVKITRVEKDDDDYKSTTCRDCLKEFFKETQGTAKHTIFADMKCAKKHPKDDE